MPRQKGHRAARSLGGLLRTLFARLCARSSERRDAGDNVGQVEEQAVANVAGTTASSGVDARATAQEIACPAPSHESTGSPSMVASGFRRASSECIGRQGPESAAQQWQSPADVAALMQEVAGFIAWEQAKGRCWMARQLPGHELSQPVGQPPTDREGRRLEGMRYKLALDKLRRQLMLGGHRQARAALEDASDWGHPGRGIDTPLDRRGSRPPCSVRYL